MRIDIISAVPELLESPLNYSIVKRAKEKGLVEIYVHNLRDYTTNKHRRVDDYAFGFSAGMVMQIEPIDKIITKLKSERTYDEIIYTSPDGVTWTLKTINYAGLGFGSVPNIKGAQAWIDFGKLHLDNALIIDGAELDIPFARAARNLPNIDVLPVQGINVYDVLRRKKLVLTKAAVQALEARFK